MVQERKSGSAAGFRQLTTLAPRVILDIAGFGGPNRAPTEGTGAPVSVIQTDLNWARLTRWRETVAQVFDNALCASRLSGLSRLMISYWGESESDIPASAFLLGGWLVNCLGWSWTPATSSNNGVKRLAFTHRGAAAALNFSYAGDNGSGNRLAGVTLASEDKNDDRVLLERDGDYLDIRIETGETQPSGTRVLFPAETDAALLNEELRIFTRDQQFEAAFNSATKIAAFTAPGLL